MRTLSELPSCVRPRFQQLVDNCEHGDRVLVESSLTTLYLYYLSSTEAFEENQPQALALFINHNLELPKLAIAKMKEIIESNKNRSVLVTFDMILGAVARTEGNENIVFKAYIVQAWLEVNYTMAPFGAIHGAAGQSWRVAK